MKNNDLQIRDKINDLRIEDYDRDAGWAQLEQRLRPHKKGILSWWYAAAACLIACATGAFLYNSHSPGKADRAGLAAVPLMEKPLPAAVNGGNEQPLMTPEKMVTLRQSRIHAPVAERSYTRVQQAVKMPVPQHTGTATGTVATDQQKPVPVAAAATPVASANRLSGPLPVLAEEVFEAIVNPEKPRPEKQQRFLKYLAARGRQTEYTAEKFSSSSTIVKF